MSDPSDLLQAAIKTRLAAAPAVAALVVERIFDDIPEDAEFPYLVIGDAQVVGDDDDCADASILTVQIHTWSRDPGWPQTNEMLAAVRGAMKADFTIAGFDVVDQTFEQTQRLRDPDGKTRHGVFEYRFLIQHHNP